MPFIIPAGGGPAAAYIIGRSLRFSSPSYLVRTPSTAGNRKQFTFSFWAKRTALSTPQPLFGILTDANNSCSLSFHAGNYLSWLEISAGAQIANVLSVAALRDPSAWAHYVISVDTTNASKSVVMWMNGVELAQQAGGLNYSGSPNSLVNSTVPHRIGSISTSSNFFEGYLADYQFIDGAIKTPSDFGNPDGATGAWVPRQFAAYLSGAWGSNGCRLPFTDNASFTTLGNDHSGNFNHYSVSTFNVTAGVQCDSYIDVPTPHGTTNDGVGGNYCTFNPLDKTTANINVANGALAATYAVATSAWGTVRGTHYVSSGKWYFEATATFIQDYVMIGVMGPSLMLPNIASAYLGEAVDGYGYLSNGTKYNNSISGPFGGVLAQGTVVGVALDLDAGTITMKIGAAPPALMYSGLSGSFAPAASVWLGPGHTINTVDLNCGQRDFQYYPLPAGHKVWCSQHTPTPTIKRGNDHMDVNTRTGNGVVFSVSGKRFMPDLVWIKSRSASANHALYDSVRGPTKDMASNLTNAETTEPQGVIAFDAGGFSGGSLAKINTSAATYVDWLFRKGATAGIDIVSVPSASAAGVNHSLGVKPEMIIEKRPNSFGDWGVTHKSLGANMKDNLILLNTTSPRSAVSNLWGGEPTATQFFKSAAVPVGAYYIAYLFASVPGFSAFGAYTGNGSADGPFVWTGFLPRWLLLKPFSASGSWAIIDTAINPYNVAGNVFFANSSNAVVAGVGHQDIVSNGFKFRGSNFNESGVSYIYAAFAEHPFKYARAR